MSSMQPGKEDEVQEAASVTIVHSVLYLACRIAHWLPSSAKHKVGLGTSNPSLGSCITCRLWATLHVISIASVVGGSMQRLYGANPAKPTCLPCDMVGRHPSRSSFSVHILDLELLSWPAIVMKRIITASSIMQKLPPPALAPDRKQELRATISRCTGQLKCRAPFSIASSHLSRSYTSEFVLCHPNSKAMLIFSVLFQVTTGDL